jgi:hypothetical protein
MEPSLNNETELQITSYPAGQQLNYSIGDNPHGRDSFICYATGRIPLHGWLTFPPDFGDNRRNLVYDAIKAEYEKYRAEKAQREHQ